MLFEWRAGYRMRTTGRKQGSGIVLGVIFVFMYFPWYLQHFGAQTVHLGWYFVTRVHLRFVEVCFKAYLGLV